MAIRWVRRVFWLVVLAVLVIAPGRLAEGPATADAGLAAPQAADAAAAPFTGLSPTLIVGAIVILLTVAAAVVRNHRTSWRM